MILLVHLLQYRLHHSEITDTRPIPITDPVIGTSLIDRTTPVHFNN